MTSKNNVDRALVRASQHLAVEIRRAKFESIERRLTAAVSELNAAHDGLARGNEPDLAKAIDAGLREIDAVLAVVRRRGE